MEIVALFIAFLPFVFSKYFDESQLMDDWKLHSALNMPFNDTSAGLQWYINTDYESHYNVRDVWKINYTGAGVVVTVVDEGLDPTHAELSRNYDKNASYDFVDNDDYPEPKNPIDRVYMTGHGSKCAGVIAAEGNNGFCGVGLAYNARIGGIRLYVDDMAPDQREAEALMYNRQYIDIYSNSWGPSSKGFEVKGPGYRTQRALRDGATEGRDKKGSIFVFAAGNGGFLAKDSCAYNGYVNSIYTIAITGLNRAGSVPSYGERCPGIMAAAYSRNTFGERNPLVTAGENGQCEYQFGGSSAATAMASGIIALTLEANPQLTWRDIQHIIARSARFPKIHKPRVNAAGLSVSNYLGFGLMDALKMVTFAKQWTKVPKQQKCEISRFVGNKSDEKKGSERDTIDISRSSKCGNIRFLEHVQVRVNLEVWPRGDLLLTLESPSKTISRLTQHRPIDRFWGHSNNLTDWTILTLHHWGEDPQGSWKLKAELGSGGRLFDWTLILYGTESDPLERNQHVMNAAVPVHPNNGPSLTGYVGYIVQVTSRYFVKMSTNTRIKLFGVLGRTKEHELTSGEKAWSRGRSQYFYFRGDPVGNLMTVQFIDQKARGYRQWHLHDVAIRQEGNNPWIVFRNNGWVNGKRITLRRECRKGYHRNSVGQCEDIDECSRNYCPQKCKNFPGGYKCFCYEGYRRNRGLAGRCTDINECSVRNGGCQQNCKNQLGYHECSCNLGYRLRRDLKTCEDINECSVRKGGCQLNCKNLPGSYECSCDEGYRLREDLKTCEAVSQEQSRPRTCKDILNLNPQRLDKLYKIYPQRQCNASVKVYCYGMATKNPTEYVPVKKLYNFVKDSRGVTFFQKVRLDPSRMLIVSNDTQFASDDKRQFGSAPSPCCFKGLCSPGYIRIDLKETELRLDQRVQWKSTSPETVVIETHYDEDGQHNIECQGCNGQCRPDGDLKVKINGC